MTVSQARTQADRDRSRRRRRTMTRAPRAIDILLLHYTGMKTAEEALARLTDPAGESLVALFRLRGRPHRSARAGGAPRLARGRGVVEGRDRHQFALDRHRDRQSRPRLRLSRLSRRADRRRDRALPRHRARAIASAASACSAHSDVAPTRKKDPGEKFPWARLAAAGIGLWVEPAPITEGGRSRRTIAAPTSRELQKQLIRFGYGRGHHASYDDATSAGRHRVPAPLPARRGSTGSPIVSTVETLRRLLARAARHRVRIRGKRLPHTSRQSAGRPLGANAERRPERKVRAPWTCGAG